MIANIVIIVSGVSISMCSLTSTYHAWRSHKYFTILLDIFREQKEFTTFLHNKDNEAYYRSYSEFLNKDRPLPESSSSISLTVTQEP